VATVELTEERQLGEPGLARRLRFRQALGRLAQRSQAVDLLKVVLVPGAVLVVGGVALMIFGWNGAAHTFRQIEQIPYLISGGLIGLALVFLGGLLLASAFWMTVLRRFTEEADERSAAQLRALEVRLDELVANSTASANGTTTSRSTRSRARR
jgi:hypothetical protein